MVRKLWLSKPGTCQVTKKIKTIMKAYDKPQVSALEVDLENVILAGSIDQPDPEPDSLPQPNPNGGYNQGNIDLAPQQKGIHFDF